MCPFKLDPCQACKEHRYSYGFRRGNSPAALQPTTVTLRAALMPEAMPSAQGENSEQGLYSASVYTEAININLKYEIIFIQTQLITVITWDYTIFWPLLHARITQELVFGPQHNTDD